MNNIPIHNKYISSEMFKEEYMKTRLRKTNILAFKDKAKRNIAYSQYINNKVGSSSSFTKDVGNLSHTGCRTEHKLIKNPQLILKNQQKLPQLGYLVTNLKAPFFSNIEADISRKLLLSKLQEEPTVEEVVKKQREEKAMRRRKSLESFTSDISDDTERRLEEIREADPNKVLQDRRDVTIHQKVSKLINEEKGIKPEDNYEDDTYRKEIDIEGLRTELNELKDTQPNYTNEIIGILHRQAEKKRTKENKMYKLVKDPRNQLMQKKILGVNDCSIFSRMYLLNNNPMFEINSNISLPYILNDSNLLANVYHVNLYKLNNMKTRHIAINK
jgi:hypothetical protein